MDYFKLYIIANLTFAVNHLVSTTITAAEFGLQVTNLMLIRADSTPAARDIAILAICRTAGRRMEL